jgi:hypothetical protein
MNKFQLDERELSTIKYFLVVSLIMSRVALCADGDREDTYPRPSGHLLLVMGFRDLQLLLLLRPDNEVKQRTIVRKLCMIVQSLQ